MKHTITRAFTMLMAMVLSVSMMSVSAFASTTDSTIRNSRVSEFAEKYSTTNFKLVYPNVGVSDSSLNELMDSFETAFPYLGGNFMKTMASYSSESKIQVTIAEMTQVYDATSPTSYSAAKPMISIWAERQDSPIQMTITVTPANGKISTQDVLTGVGNAFDQITRRGPEGYTTGTILPQWAEKYPERHTDYADMYAQMFAVGIINGADKPAVVGSKEYEYGKQIYDDLVKIMGYNCTATQRMGGYLGIDISDKITK